MSERIVVDTNVFVAALRSAEGSSRELLRRCLLNDFCPLMGHKLFREYVEVLDRTEIFSKCPVALEERQELLAGILAVCEWVEVFFLWRPNLPDEGDNHVFELAAAGGASAVVTHNVADFRGELRFPTIKIVTPAEFLKLKR